MKFLISFVLLATIGCLSAEKNAYKGYQLVRLFPKTEQQTELIFEWQNDPDFDLWGRINRGHKIANVLLSPQAFRKYKILFDLNEFSYTVIEQDIQSRIDEQLRSMIREKGDERIAGKFARYSEIINYINNQVSANPSFVSSYVAGQTYEKRDLKVAVIKSETSSRKIWIDCGIHAREWISPAACVWIIDKLISEKNAGVQSTVDLLAKFEFHIMPLVNPDGYEYSHTTFRLWRKNRRPNQGSSCIGTDLNRNWGYKWLTGGSSTSPCSDLYAGPTADSELETKAVQAAILKYPGQWDSYITIHTYGQWWFTTWGYTTVNPPNYTELMAKSKIGVDAIKAVNGVQFTYGPSSQILYIASGGSEDWADAVAKIPYSFCLELRPGQSGPDSNYGFTLPEDRAPKSSEETYQGIKAFLKSIL